MQSIRFLKKIFLAVFISLNFSVQAQPGGYSTTNEKAIKCMEEAQYLVDRRQDTKAIEELDKAIAIDPNFLEAHLMKAGLYDDLGNFEKSVESYLRAIQINPDGYYQAYLALAKVEMKLMKYDDAIAHINKFFEYPRISPNFKTQAEQLLKTAKFASNAVKNPVPFNPINLGPNINSNRMEYFPSVTADEQTLIFTRNEPFDTVNPKAPMREDFYFSTLKNGTWQKAVNAGKPLNTYANEGAQTITPDGQQLLFTVCEEIDGYPPGRSGNGRCDVFYTYRVGGSWAEPKNINRPISIESWDAQPCMASDGKTFYFVSNRKGGYGGMDIWKCYIKEDNSWSEVINLGPNINTSGNEMSVFIHPDNQTLYFSSDGHLGMGKHDLFISRANEKGEWGEAKNMGYPINTPGDEYRLVVNAKGDKAYYASDRPGGFGQLDIYVFDLPVDEKPLSVTYFKGKVYDAGSKQPLGAKFELIDLNTGKPITVSFANNSTGEFLVCLPPNRNYALNASKDGYLFYSENFDLTNYNSTEPFKADIPLVSVKPGSKVVLKNIFFETAKFDLKDQSKYELNKLVAFLNTNATTKIEIGGHTDNVGDKKSNQLLSENRAKAVYDYLIANKIAPDRLSYKGYGDSQPIDDNKTEKGRANNRRTEFTIK